MRIRVGVLDIATAIIVAVAILLPARTPTVSAAHPPLDDRTQREIASLQARLLVNPGDGEAAEALASLLAARGYSDWALRVAGSAARGENSPTRWRAQLAVSAAHADRIEIEEALAWAKQALATCEAERQDCPSHEQVRLSIYLDQLEAGLRSGVDPRVDPDAFRAAIRRSGVRSVRIEAKPGAPASSDEGEPVPTGEAAGAPEQTAPEAVESPPAAE